MRIFSGRRRVRWPRRSDRKSSDRWRRVSGRPRYTGRRDGDGRARPYNRRETMLTKTDLLAEMNRDIPAGVDWKAGARAYVANCFEKYGRKPIERYSMNK